MRPTVVLIHGLGRTQRSMRPLSFFLQSKGYRTVLHDYAPRRLDLRTLILQLHAQLSARNHPRHEPIHFVTHSLGGILLRAYLASDEAKHLSVGRIVMLAPPNHGSEIIDFWRGQRHRKAFFKYFMGDIALSLHTGSDSLPNRLPTFEQHRIGIISGTRSVEPWFEPLFAGAHDGKVSVESAHLHSHAHISLPVTHTFLMNHTDVRQATLQFLQHGSF